MADFYKVLKADALGEPWSTHGKTMQTFWCKVEDVDEPVSITKQTPNVVHPGQHVYGDLMVATSQKGTTYYKFKSAQVPEGIARPRDERTPSNVSSPPVTDLGANMPGWFMPVANQINEIHKMLTAMQSSDVDQYKEVKAIMSDPVMERELDKAPDYVPEDEAPDPRVAFGE